MPSSVAREMVDAGCEWFGSSRFINHTSYTSHTLAAVLMAGSAPSAHGDVLQPTPSSLTEVSLMEEELHLERSSASSPETEEENKTKDGGGLKIVRSPGEGGHVWPSGGLL
ncbi:hypothetical protein EYF80_052230 [Liparis tanakae]|uniref:Uncharacterized protein n=1 Tax=Liparis tanakae TaxID=230148 RepID=A0A4Z2F8Q0_9TELE|nr:hypothetical protein EYF80_052230 [Liparis tanakae]